MAVRPRPGIKLSEAPACLACGSWTCLNCVTTRKNVSRYSHTKCHVCGGEEGEMRPTRHLYRAMVEDHADLAADYEAGRMLAPVYPPPFPLSADATGPIPLRDV